MSELVSCACLDPFWKNGDFVKSKDTEGLVGAELDMNRLRAISMS